MNDVTPHATSCWAAYALSTTTTVLSCFGIFKNRIISVLAFPNLMTKNHLFKD